MHVPEQLHVALVWDDVIHHVCGRSLALPLAFRAVWIPLQERIPRNLPLAIITALRCRRPSLINLALYLLSVFLAFAMIGQCWTSRVRTRMHQALRFTALSPHPTLLTQPPHALAQHFVPALVRSPVVDHVSRIALLYGADKLDLPAATHAYLLDALFVPVLGNTTLQHGGNMAKSLPSTYTDRAPFQKIVPRGFTYASLDLRCDSLNFNFPSGSRYAIPLLQ